MIKWETVSGVALIAVFMLLVNCNRGEDGFLKVSIIVGDAQLIRKGVTEQLVPQKYLQAGDTLKVRENAKVKLETAGDAAWYVNRNTVLAFNEPVALSGETRRLPVALLSGCVHVVKRKESAEEYLFSALSWKARITVADVTVCADSTEAGVTLLSGFTTFTSAEGNETVIPACNRLKIGGNGEAVLNPLTGSDIQSVKEWVGTTVIDEAVARSACAVEKEPVNNLPPIWQRLPRESASPGEFYRDTVEAADPEQGPLTYSLVKAPAGLTIDSSGGITYPEPVAGRYEVVIVATDNAAQSCTASVALTVSAGLTLRISAPRHAVPGERFTIAAITRGVDKKKVRYRFDLNGDGVFELPAKGQFGKRSYVAKYAYTEEGVYRMRVEARTDDGQKASARRQIVINAPPVAVLKANPLIAATGMPVELDLSESADSRNGATPLRIRIDVNGDGTWDIPGGDDYASQNKMVYSWDQPGTYTVVAEVTDKDGAASTASVTVTVNKGIQGGTLSLPDTVHIGDSITISCTPQGGKFKVVEFAWSFNGDTIFERTTKTSSLRTAFPKEGIRSVLCRLTDEKGGQVAVSKVVTVLNSNTEVEAGGPYSGPVNTKIKLHGSGSDRDSKIVSYAWDFDGDGTADWTSATETGTSNVYKKAGTYIAIFTVATGDGSKTIDSAIVKISNKPPTANAGEDVLSRKKRKLKLSGTASDPDSNIVLYEWDFDSDGTADWSSKDNSVVEHAFSSYSEAIFSVRDADGAVAKDTIKIIICPDDMQTITKGKFCIDTYEFPNKRKAKPQAVSYNEAARICKSLGKRLCTADEWELACTDGRKKYEYPYGKKYDVDKCNTLGNPRVKNSMANSGEFFECKTASGVFDMSGNLAEWTSRGTAALAHGGSWQNGREGSGCQSKVQLGKAKKYFYVGFRCCK